MAITNFLPKTRAMVDRIYGFLKARPLLLNMVLRVAQKHDNWMGYRKYGTPSRGLPSDARALGLMRDDILPSENPVVQEAIKRLPDKEAFDRTFRLRRAIQLYMNHEELPVSQQISQADVGLPAWLAALLMRINVGQAVSVGQG